MKLKKRIVVGMSGGVDSSVAALLLKEEGFEVIGAMMKLADPSEMDTGRASCCSASDASDARRVCEQLGIPFYVFNAKEIFKTQVIDDFVSTYLTGRTPNPCVRCNDQIKFEYFFKKARSLGAECIATGHYVKSQMDPESKNWRLFKAKDLSKDQSYFLFTMTQTELAYTLFPLSHYSKTEVRSLASQAGLLTSQKRESQEICFVQAGHHGAFIDQYLEEISSKRGNFIDEAGEVLGEHSGIHHYTIGQRRGTQVAAGQRIYIRSIDAQSQNIVLSKEEGLYTSSLLAGDLRWIRKPKEHQQVTARIRYGHEGARAFLEDFSNNKVKVCFSNPQRAIAPGQAVVFYKEEEVLGGGWIL